MGALLQRSVCHRVSASCRQCLVHSCLELFLFVEGNATASLIWPFPYRSYVVDAADRDTIPISKSELHDLLGKPSLNGIPLLVLGNKIDKENALSMQALSEQM